MVKRIKLTGFGEQVKLGLSPKTKSYIGKVIKDQREWENIMNELGSSNHAILTLEDIK